MGTRARRASWWCMLLFAAACGRAPGARDCTTDQDCAWKRSGCCDACLSGPGVAPSGVCTVLCPESAAGCFCQAGQCTPGELPTGSACDPARDQCAGGEKCCAAPDGGTSCAMAVPAGDHSYTCR